MDQTKNIKVNEFSKTQTACPKITYYLSFPLHTQSAYFCLAKQAEDSSSSLGRCKWYEISIV